MQIVIDIPDRIFKMVCNNHRMGVIDCDVIHEVIANGTPLPKGHGKLKDIDKIISDGISKGFCDWYDEMEYAPTIIEADKESEE